MKDDHDFLGIADKAAEKKIQEILHHRFPGDQIIGEESGGTLSGSTWVVDPIDGTSNYVHRLPDWCVSIAYVLNGVTEIGIIYAPVYEQMYTVVRGFGAKLNGKPIQVAEDVPISQCIVELDWSHCVPKQDFYNLIKGVLNAGFDFRRCGSAALALARVSEGTRHAFCELFSKPWDFLAGALLVTEAGGWTNNFNKNLWENNGNPIIACSPFLKESLGKIPELKKLLSE